MKTDKDAAEYAAGVLGTLGLRAGATPYEIASAAMGWDFLRKMPLRVGESALMRVRDQWQVVLRQDLAPERARWVFAWQLSSWLLRTDGVDGPEAARLRSPLAAELLMPRDTTTRAIRTARPEDVARVFQWPLAATLLREAELERVPTLLVLPSGHVRRRGDDAGRLPSDDEHARRLALQPAIGVVRYAVAEGVIVRAA